MGKTLFVGIDPAPREAGISLLVYGKSGIKTENFKTDSLKSSFANWFLRTSVITSQLIEVIESVKDVDRKVIIMEYPPPSGIFAPALYGMDYMLLDRIRDASVVLAHPKLIQSLAGKRTNKKISKKLSKPILELNGLFIDKPKVTDHEADATVLLLWGMFNITHKLKLPEKKDFNFSLERWTWRIKKVDLCSIMEEHNVKLFDYIGSENAIR